MSGRWSWLARSGAAPHILPTATAMIGVSTTLVGLVKLHESRAGPSRVDEFSGLVALLFLVSAVTSYLSVRVEGQPRLSLVTERMADGFFFLGLIGITGIAILFAYELI